MRRAWPGSTPSSRRSSSRTAATACGEFVSLVLRYLKHNLKADVMNQEKEVPSWWLKGHAAVQRTCCCLFAQVQLNSNRPIIRSRRRLGAAVNAKIEHIVNNLTEGFCFQDCRVILAYSSPGLSGPGDTGTRVSEGLQGRPQSWQCTPLDACNTSVTSTLSHPARRSSPVYLSSPSPASHPSIAAPSQPRSPSGDSAGRCWLTGGSVRPGSDSWVGPDSDKPPCWIGGCLAAEKAEGLPGAATPSSG